MPSRFDPYLILRQIGLPRRLTAHSLIGHYADALAREIRMTAIPGLSATLGWCGLWIRGSDLVEYVFIDEAAAASPVLETAIAAHEIGHIVAGHEQEMTNEGGLVALLKQRFPMLPPDMMIKAVMARTTYELQAEQEAERFATLVMARANLQSSTSIGRAAERALNHWKGRTP